MANRPVFVPKYSAPFRTSVSIEFTYNSGLSASQKRKNIAAIHAGYLSGRPGKKILEISSKSTQPGGVELSAFNLKKFVPSLNTSVPVENAYQAGKVFRDGGPYTELLTVHPREAKRDERLHTSGPLTGFSFEGRLFPTKPETAFYDWLYINALLENPEMADIVLQYDAFTDIEFSPQRSVSCQAKSAAMFVALHRLNLLSAVKDFDSFSGLCGLPTVTPAAAEPEPAEAEAPGSAPPSVSAGTVIRHRVWGEGTVLEISGTLAVVDFASVGQKKLSLSWLTANCGIL